MTSYISWSRQTIQPIRVPAMEYILDILLMEMALW